MARGHGQTMMRMGIGPRPPRFAALGSPSPVHVTGRCSSARCAYAAGFAATRLPSSSLR